MENENKEQPKNLEITELKNGIMYQWDAPENEFGIIKMGFLLPMKIHTDEKIQVQLIDNELK